MYENIQEYYFPKSISDVVAKLQKHSSKSAVVCAGGINLTWRKLPKVTCVIDISRLGLSYIKSDKTRIRIGATTTLQELVDSKLISKIRQKLTDVYNIQQVTNCCQYVTLCLNINILNLQNKYFTNVYAAILRK